MHHNRRAFTLLEVIMAGGIFFLAMAAVMETAVASRHLNSLGAAKDQVELDANSIIRSIASDLALSGWEFGSATPAPTFASVTPAIDRTLRYYPMVQIQRSPNDANTEGFNTALPWTRLDASMLALPALPSVLPGTAADKDIKPLTDDAWNRSFHARSAQLVFLRATVGSWRPDQIPGSASDESVYFGLTPDAYLSQRPDQIQLPILNFSTDSTGQETSWKDWRMTNAHNRLHVLFSTGFQEGPPGTWVQRYPNQPYGVTLDGGWYDWTDLETAPIKPAWETMRKPNTSGLPTITGMTADEVRRAYAIAPELWREYTYAVVPSPAPLGLGRLVRAHRVPNADLVPIGVEPGQRISEDAEDDGLIATEKVGMVIDKVLSDDVVRVVFDTYRTVNNLADLGLNQVRVRLYLARRQVTNPQIVIHRVVETTLSMRARSSGGDMQRIFATLGSTRIGLVR